MKELFLLDPKTVFLNHGSFGACPKPVFEKYQSYQLQLENQPVKYFVQDVALMLGKSRAKLADFLNVDVENLAFVNNATTAVNLIANSLNVGVGEEVLASNHEYGACSRMWKQLAERRKFSYREHEVQLPLYSDEDFVENFWADVRPETKVIFLSHITSTSALILPVAEICKRAKAQGILTIIDGAHAPGQIPLDLSEIPCDYYTGNCHKWMLSAKGSAFLYVSEDEKKNLHPQIISWGTDLQSTGDTALAAELEYQGTRDFAAFLSVSDAIDFHAEFNWNEVLQQKRHLLYKVRTIFSNIFETAPIATPEFMPMMYAHQLPDTWNPIVLKQKLLEDFNIEIPVTSVGTQNFLRISVQGYTSFDDIEKLANALELIKQQFV